MSQMIKELLVPHNHIDVTDLSSNLIFRQSLTNDILACPKMASYRWIYEFADSSDEYGETKIPYLATLLGTAGHSVIEIMHIQKKFDYNSIELIQMFTDAAHEALEEYPIPPALPAGEENINEAIEMKALEYSEFIEGYQKQHLALPKRLIISMFEQEFVLIIRYKEEEYIFAGTIDQGGIYEDNVMTLRDLKFRDNAFKPNYIKLSLSHQMIVYAAAMKYGLPACKDCKPKYLIDDGAMTRDIQYNGPCEKCKEKIGTFKWPGKFPTQCELVWMKDFAVLKRASRGRKKGDFKGKGIYTIYLKKDRITNYLEDVLEWCHVFRHGFAPRNPGEMCMTFCDYKNQCLAELRSEDAFHAEFIDSLQ